MSKKEKRIEKYFNKLTKRHSRNSFELRCLTNSTTSATLLSKLLYWATKKKKFYKTDIKLILETGLSVNELRSAKKEIAELSFVKVTKEGKPPKTYYEIDENAFKHAVLRNLVNLTNLKYFNIVNFTKLRNSNFSLDKTSKNLNSLNSQSQYREIHKLIKYIQKKNKFSSKTLKTAFSQNEDFNSCEQHSCPEEETYIYKSCYKIWTDYKGKPFVRKKSQAKNFAREFVAKLFSSDRNPYYDVCPDENKELKKKKWTLSDFEQAVKNYKGEKVTLDVFIFKPSYGYQKPRSRLLESFLDSQRDKFDFKGKYAETANFILRFYRNQIGDPDKVNPGVFVNAAKQIDKISKKYVVNPTLLHPENQLWYKFMQYAKQEMKANDSFIPAFISSDNFAETFIRKASKNGALIDRQKGQWH